MERGLNHSRNQASRNYPMQITLNLDESLLDEALQLTNLTTQEELVNLALQELVRSRRKKNLLDLAGQIQFTEDFDYKALRETRHAAD
jgi:Arc/MetJ family transcription regulator